jgi:phage repressor protein C with HTH and peptisase S24 domain
VFIRGSRRVEMIVFNVSGTSMFPLIREGDILLAEKRGAVSFSWGDILLYETGGKFFAHRLIWKFRNAYLMKADTHFSFERINKEQIKGKVEALARNGRVIDLVAPLNKVFSVFLAVFLFPVSFVYNLITLTFILSPRGRGIG